jgi:hypothetical protein
MGFYCCTAWKTYMTSGGCFFLSGAGTNSLTWDSCTLTINGAINIIGGTAATQISNAALCGTNACAAALAAQTTATTACNNAATAQGTANHACNCSYTALSRSVDSVGKITFAPTPAGNGLFLSSTHMGFYCCTAWKTYMNCSGHFFLSGAGNNGLSWNGSTLSIDGDITARNGTFLGTITSTATISGGTISGGTITGGTINIGPNKFQVDSSGNATISGNMTVNSNVIIRGWKDVLASGMNPQTITPGGNFEFRDPDTPATIMGFLRGYKTIYNEGIPGLESIERNTVLSALTSFTFGQYAGGPWATLDGTKLQVWGDIVGNYSDGRLKNIEGKIKNPLDKIGKINGVYYTQNKLAEDFGFKNKKRQIGLIAQEVNEVLPEVVDLAPFDSLGQTNQSKSGENYMTLRYERITPLLLEGIKELHCEMKELKCQINILKSR